MSALEWIRKRYGQLGRSLAVFARARRAVSTVEYALITIAVISIVGAAIALLGVSFTGLFDDIADELKTAQAAAGTAGVT